MGTLHYKLGASFIAAFLVGTFSIAAGAYYGAWVVVPVVFVGSLAGIQTYIEMSERRN